MTSPHAPPGTPPFRQLGREHPTYVGFVLLALALAAGAHPAWLGLLLAVALAPGGALTWMGTPLGEQPGWALAAKLPGLGQVHHAGRLLLGGHLALLVLAGRGAARLVVRFPSLPHRVHAAVALEALLLAPARLPLPSSAAESPAIYSSLAGLPPGPLSVGGAAGPGVSPQRVFYDRRAHGRALLHDPNFPRDGAPEPGAVFVALGAPGTPARARAEATLGSPEASTSDGAAWWVPPRP